MSLRDVLGKKVLVGDGAMGTSLYAFGVYRSHEELNLSHPAAIKEIHREYLEAGSDLIQTNTYAANRLKLERYGLTNSTEEINRAAVKLAKEAVAEANLTRPVYILGTIGGIYSPGERLLNDYAIEEVVASFKEQLDVLLEAGVDGLLLETYYDLAELKTVLKIARQKTTIPILTNVTMQEAGYLSDGTKLNEALQELTALGADGAGANCILGPKFMVDAFQNVSSIPNRALICYPNASLPVVNEGRVVYQSEPSYFADYSELFRHEGISLIGGCCGTTPEHIRAFVEGLASREIIVDKQDQPAKKQELATIQRKGRGIRIASKVKEEVTILVELDPPRNLRTQKFFEGIQILDQAGADKITISDNSLARPRISNLALAAVIKHKYQIDPLIHLTTRDHNLIGLASQVMGFHELGMFDILAVTGDPAKVGDFPGASSVFDTTSMGLIKMIKQFNEGISYTGMNLREASDFQVGAAFNPNVPKMERAVRVIKKKAAAGADYIMTQPIYDISKIKVLREALDQEEITTPLFIGIQPLVSSRNAEFLHNEIPGIVLTDEVREEMRAAEAQGHALETGAKAAKRLIDEVLKYFNGIYLITPFQHYELTTELIQYVKAKKKSRVEV